MGKISFLVLTLFLVGDFIANAQLRIIGGSAVDISQRPYQAAVFINGAFTGGGVIISPYHILTAAHVVCASGQVTPLSPSSFKVGAGYTNLDNDNNRRSVQSVTVHPQFHYEYPNQYSEIPYDDIAIIKLSSPLTYNTDIQPIEISSSASYPSGTQAVVSGWGRKYVYGEPNLSQLYKANVSVSSCTSKQIIAAASQNTTYHGDSGGPLTITSNGNDILVGLVSAVHTSSPTTNPSYYTNVGSYYDWILSKMVSLSGPTAICAQGTFTLSNLPDGATVSWSSLNAGVAAINQAGVLTRTGSNNGSCNVQATVTIGGNTFQAPPRKVWVGEPLPQDVTLTVESLHGGGVLCSDNPNAVMACHAGEPRSDFVLEYEWQAGAGWQIGEHPGASSPNYPENFIITLIPTTGAGNASISVRARSACGWGDWKNVVIPASPCGGSFTVSTYPNPVNDVLKLSIRTTDEVRRQQLEALAAGKSKAMKERTYTVQLFGTTGNLVQQKKAAGDDIGLSFDVSSLPNGTYFVVVKLNGSGEEPQRATVIVRK